ncbi:MAG: histidine phosphatase family protein [Pseudonocardiaceae bacterium]|nr:histidine phosphatase family protein [Pseudonocardiaceae bacterium]
MIRTVVHLLRHGEVHNPEGVIYGRLPGYRLSDIGQRQGDLVAAHLAGRDIVHVAASPMQRAQQTAAPIAARLGLDVAADDGLIEASNRFEGLQVSVGDGLLHKPRYWPLLLNPFRPSWGEPYAEVAQRMLAAAHRARERAAGHEAVCVSHQLPIYTLRRRVERKRLWHDPRRRQCSLASLTSLIFDGDTVADVSYTEPAELSDPRQAGA